MKSIISATLAIAALGASAWAQDDDCIENVVGQLVCGADADAVRARIRAEEEYAKAAAAGRDPSEIKPRRSSSGSVYGRYGQAAFVRGGYGFSAHSGGASGSADTLLGAVGYRTALGRGSGSRFSLETELVYTGDSETALGIEATATSYTGLFSLRWDAAPSSFINPFLSAGVGPAYYHLKLSDGVTSISDGSFVFGYSGRAGIEANFAAQFSLEAAYRYLGATDDGTYGLHAAEIGLNYKF
ncbi:MAG: outer membrane beta-barrel protein [Oricola sp.]|jgi:opacity protein-like surface antigen|nr:outer membrane beta-barrel protein [Oricola sp.]